MWVEILVRACPWLVILVLVFLERPLTTALVLWFFNNRLINPSSNQVFIVAMANLWGLFRNTSLTNKPLSLVQQQFQQWRGIKVKVEKGNLDKALVVMQRKMQSSGIERLIKRQQITHIKNSEKRILARKNLERRLRSQDLARKLKSILIKKVRGL